MTSPTPFISGVSLGMVIIDDIRIPNKAPLTDVVGGSGSFVTLGQRLFEESESFKIGCLVLAGDDFPEVVKTRLRSFGVTLVVKKKGGATSTRGLLDYEDDTFGRE